jgi:hypothetical protein
VTSSCMIKCYARTSVITVTSWTLIVKPTVIHRVPQIRAIFLVFSRLRALLGYIQLGKPLLFFFFFFV